MHAYSGKIHAGYILIVENSYISTYFPGGIFNQSCTPLMSSFLHQKLDKVIWKFSM